MTNSRQPVVEPPVIQILADPAFEEQQLAVQVLRIDAIHAVVSGNKWMKLQPWLRLALQKQLSAVVTKGGPWSNHLHAAAFAARAEGLALTAIVKGREGMTTPMLQNATAWGAKLLFANDATYRNEQLWTTMAEEQNALYIPMGGEGELAVEGVTNYMNHLNLAATDYIICPVGTGTTLQGIAASNISYKTLLGINAGITDTSYQQMLFALRQQYASKHFVLLRNESLKKFGKWPPALINEMNSWYNKWRLPTDVVYTAKMFSIFTGLVKQEYFKPGSRILLIHTGGLQGNRSVADGLLKF